MYRVRSGSSPYVQIRAVIDVHEQTVDWHETSGEESYVRVHVNVKGVDATVAPPGGVL